MNSILQEKCLLIILTAEPAGSSRPTELHNVLWENPDFSRSHVTPAATCTCSELVILASFVVRPAPKV